MTGWDKIEFYGQRPWRLVNRTEQFDAVREQLAVLALQYREKFMVDHSVCDYFYYFPKYFFLNNVIFLNIILRRLLSVTWEMLLDSSSFTGLQERDGI